jgi:hypothetical protein
VGTATFKNNQYKDDNGNWVNEKYDGVLENLDGSVSLSRTSGPFTTLNWTTPPSKSTNGGVLSVGL